MPKKSEVDSLLQQHRQLTHSENMKVQSHVQREEDDWIVHTIMLQDIDVPFIFKRKKRYKSLVGNRVNLTYYPDNKIVAEMTFETMKVVRIKAS